MASQPPESQHLIKKLREGEFLGKNEAQNIIKTRNPPGTAVDEIISKWNRAAVFD